MLWAWGCDCIVIGYTMTTRRIHALRTERDVRETETKRGRRPCCVCGKSDTLRKFVEVVTPRRKAARRRK